ncbi:hypothetical protein NFI96_024683 [Prochilodus magdalenae]|nr:hypothetical protein NFI96_024683 [Prochilodus magdalenae]
MLSDASNVMYMLLELVIALLSILGNVLVCWAVGLNTNLQSITNFFVVSLAIADIAVGVLAIPFSVVISTGFCANFYGCLFIACFVLVLTQSSIFSLLAIAIDRYIAIKIPLRFFGRGDRRSEPQCYTELLENLLLIILPNTAYLTLYSDHSVQYMPSPQLLLELV